eukprot:3262451-Rhodomonas_salina.1
MYPPAYPGTRVCRLFWHCRAGCHLPGYPKILQVETIVSLILPVGNHWSLSTRGGYPGYRDSAFLA